MNEKGLNQAKARLNSAVAAVKRLEAAAPVMQEFEDAWADFLMALNSVFSKREAGAISSTKSVGWFSRIKHLRRKDPLLVYLRQARHSEQHKLETGIYSQPAAVHRKFVVSKVLSNKELQLRPLNEFKHLPGVAGHTRITDSWSGRHFDPPREHLGKPIKDNTPLVVANLGLAYAGKIVLEAEGLRHSVVGSLDHSSQTS